MFKFNVSTGPCFLWSSRVEFVPGLSLGFWCYQESLVFLHLEMHHTAPVITRHSPSVSVFASLSSSCKYTSHTGLRAHSTLVWSHLNVHLDYNCKDCISKKGHIHSYQWLGLQYVWGGGGRAQFSPQYEEKERNYERGLPGFRHKYLEE